MFFFVLFCFVLFQDLDHGLIGLVFDRLNAKVDHVSLVVWIDDG
jgi:hypothetical protein